MEGGDDHWDDEWAFRAHARASIIYGDPIWAAQEYAMQRGERRRGDYDPPISEAQVDALVQQYRAAQVRRKAGGEPPAS